MYTGIEIGKTSLKRLPRAPYQVSGDWNLETCFSKDEQEKYREWRKSKWEIIRENSSRVFDEEFLKDYKRNIDSLELDFGFREEPVKILCKEFGFDLTKHPQQNWQIKTLQIGCGPGDGYHNGPNLDKILLKLGADTMNLDILDVSNYYPAKRFNQGSWLGLEKYFEEKTFDAIFMDNMNPDIKHDITNFYETENLNVACQNLILKTMSRIKHNGLFFISGIDSACFSIPEDVNDVINSSFIQSNYILPSLQGAQIYKKRF